MSFPKNLSRALEELKSANEKLKSDIEMERKIEKKRIAFFSAVSHELKTPITILKGHLSGMLQGVGEYGTEITICSGHWKPQKKWKTW